MRNDFERGVLARKGENEETSPSIDAGAPASTTFVAGGRGTQNTSLRLESHRYQVSVAMSRLDNAGACFAIVGGHRATNEDARRVAERVEPFAVSADPLVPADGMT